MFSLYSLPRFGIEFVNTQIVRFLAQQNTLRVGSDELVRIQKGAIRPLVDAVEQLVYHLHGHDFNVRFFAEDQIPPLRAYPFMQLLDPFRRRLMVVRHFSHVVEVCILCCRFKPFGIPRLQHHVHGFFFVS